MYKERLENQYMAGNGATTLINNPKKSSDLTETQDQLKE
jgi:hypothetical protein